MDKTSIRVTAIASALAVVILTVGVAGFAVAFPSKAAYNTNPASQEIAAQVAAKQTKITVADQISNYDRLIAKLKAEAEEEAREAAEDKAEAEYKAKIGSPDAAEEAREAEESAREAAAAQKAYEDALAASGQNAPAQSQPAPQANNNGGTWYGDDQYKVEGGVVYEWDDDGYWEPEYDNKIEGGVVYEYDDGRWEVDDDDWDDDWDD